jgi:hemoglobin
LGEEGMSAGILAGVLIRNSIVEDIVERTGIDEVMIEQLVRTFYSRARFDPLVGPVFEK